MNEHRLTALEVHMQHLIRRVEDNAAAIRSWGEHNNRVGSRLHVVEVDNKAMESRLNTTTSLDARLSAIEQCLSGYKRAVRLAILALKAIATVLLILGVISGKISQEQGKAALKVIGGGL